MLDRQSLIQQRQKSILRLVLWSCIAGCIFTTMVVEYILTLLPIAATTIAFWMFLCPFVIVGVGFGSYFLSREIFTVYVTTALLTEHPTQKQEEIEVTILSSPLLLE